MEKKLYLDVSTVKKDSEGNPVDGSGRVYEWDDKKAAFMFKNVNVAKNFVLLEVVEKPKDIVKEEPIKAKQEEQIEPINTEAVDVVNEGTNEVVKVKRKYTKK